jgi:hypothetical protein
MDVLVCLLLALLAAIPLLVFLYHNKDSKKVERFFYHHDHQNFILLQICIFVLSIAFLLNVRMVGMYYVNMLLEQWGFAELGISFKLH